MGKLDQLIIKLENYREVASKILESNKILVASPFTVNSLINLYKIKKEHGDNFLFNDVITFIKVRFKNLNHNTTLVRTKRYLDNLVKEKLITVSKLPNDKRKSIYTFPSNTLDVFKKLEEQVK